MRRLLYLALVLVLLAITGLAFARVTGSPAYVVRERFMKIQMGMSREQVEKQMAGLREVDFLNQCWIVDSEHRIIVSYDSDRVCFARISEEPTEEALLGKILDFVGFKSSIGE